MQAWNAGTLNQTLNAANKRVTLEFYYDKTVAPFSPGPLEAARIRAVFNTATAAAGGDVRVQFIGLNGATALNSVTYGKISTGFGSAPNTYRTKIDFVGQNAGGPAAAALASSYDGVYSMTIYPNMMNERPLNIAFADTVAHEFGYHILGRSPGAPGAQGHAHDAVANPLTDANFIDAASYANWGLGNFSPTATTAINSRFGF